MKKRCWLIQMIFRFSRSAAIPATGLKSVMGKYATSPDIPSINGDDVFSASHQIRANWTPWLPSRETACPSATARNFVFHLSFSNILIILSGFVIGFA